MDRDELARLAAEMQAAMGRGEGSRQDPLSGEPFASPILASDLRKIPPEARWLWEGCLGRGSITLLSALWKAGKSTLLALLLRALEQSGEFVGRKIQAATVLYVTEEPEDVWADRRDNLGLSNHCAFQVRPFPAKPFWGRWAEFLAHLKAEYANRPYDVLILDTISNLWPVRDENDACQVQSALQPLQTLVKDLSILIVHHLRKGDGQEATGNRGSGAFTAFVDIILELRRFNPGDKHDRRRVLTGYGRFTEIPNELVIELSEDATRYHAIGERQEAQARDLVSTITRLLPNQPPGMTYSELVEEWPDAAIPTKARLLAALHDGADRGLWQEDGEGVRGNPCRWWQPVRDSVSVFSYREKTETESRTHPSNGTTEEF